MIFSLISVLISFLIVEDIPCKYENYFYYSQSASIEYFQNNNPSIAKSYYLKAFDTGLFPLAKDLASALELATQLKDDQWALELASQLAKGGIPKDYFIKHSDSSWFEEFEDEFQYNRDYFKKHYNLNLRADLLQLRRTDSLYNVLYHQWRKNEIDLSYEQLLNGVLNVNQELTDLIKQYGFPHQEKSGYFYNGNTVEDFPFSIVLHHIFQLGDCTLKKYLSEIVCNGSLRPIDETQLSHVLGFSKCKSINEEMEIRWQRRNNKD